MQVANLHHLYQIVPAIEHAVDPSTPSANRKIFQFEFEIWTRELIVDLIVHPNYSILERYIRINELNVMELGRLPSVLIISLDSATFHASENDIRCLLDTIIVSIAEKADENGTLVRHMISMTASNGNDHIVFKTVGEGEWVALSKDANVERLGSWNGVTTLCCSKGFVPNGLLYEEVEVLLRSIERDNNLRFKRKCLPSHRYIIYLFRYDRSGASKLAFNFSFSNYCG